MWIVCSLCGALVAVVDLHQTWHTANGDPGTVVDIASLIADSPPAQIAPAEGV